MRSAESISIEAMPHRIARWQPRWRRNGIDPTRPPRFLPGQERQKIGATTKTLLLQFCPQQSQPLAIPPIQHSVQLLQKSDQKKPNLRDSASSSSREPFGLFPKSAKDERANVWTSSWSSKGKTIVDAASATRVRANQDDRRGRTRHNADGRAYLACAVRRGNRQRFFAIAWRGHSSSPRSRSCCRAAASSGGRSAARRVLHPSRV